MSWKEQLNGDTVSWLLEENKPGVRYLAMRELLEFPLDDAELLVAQEKAHAEGVTGTSFR